MPTSAANLRTRPHLFVISEALTISRAPLAYFRASSAGRGVKIGSAQHKGNVGIADFDAIEQQANVSGLDVTSTAFDTVAQGLGADVMALATTGDAVLKVDGCMHVRDGFEFRIDFACPTSRSGGEAPILI
jgi:hypothetical protein